MEQTILTIEKNEHITRDVMRMVLTGEGLGEHRPGQFINIRIAGMFLRRPISVHDYEPGRLTLLYKIVGRGTAAMSMMCPGGKLDVLTQLGNGFDTTEAGGSPLLIGGGIGTAPLYYLARVLRGEGREVTVILGFNTASEIYYEEEFRALGCRVLVSTADGSYGVRGFVTDAVKVLMAETGSCGKAVQEAEDGREKDTVSVPSIPGAATDKSDTDSAAGRADGADTQSGQDTGADGKLPWSYAYICGPEPMLRAVYPMIPHGQFSFEERMGCGFGACMGCSCRTITGYKRICKDGPVLTREEILWEEHK